MGKPIERTVAAATVTLAEGLELRATIREHRGGLAVDLREFTVMTPGKLAFPGSRGLTIPVAAIEEVSAALLATKAAAALVRGAR